MASKSQAEAKLVAKYKDKTTEEDLKWQREIEQLERRTKEHTDLDIGDGVKIAIFTRLSEKRKRLYAGLVKELKSLGTKTKVGTGVYDEDGREIEEWTIKLNESDENTVIIYAISDSIHQRNMQNWMKVKRYSGWRGLMRR